MDVKSIIKEYLGVEKYKLVEEISKLATEEHTFAYIVGGPVRDLLLKINKNIDLDIVIDPTAGSNHTAITFSEVVAKKLGGKIKKFDTFITAKVELPNGVTIDFATARKEFYSKPAALPVVSPASIYEDLKRRDFTINAIAIQLSPVAYFGEIIDVVGGKRDLGEKILRVLHPYSFWEDPTRMFRLIRFCGRLKFSVSPETERYFISGIKIGLPKLLSRDRLREQVALLFSEEDTLPCVRLLYSSGLHNFVFPKTSLNEESLSIIENVNKVPCSTEEKIILHFVVILNIYENMKSISSVLERLNLPKKEKSLIITLIRSIRIIREVIKASHGKDYNVEAEIQKYHVLKNLPEVGWNCLSLYFYKNKNIVRKYQQSVANSKPILTGEDLKNIGFPEGPLYFKILARLAEERFLGKLHTKEDEIKFVKAHFATAK
jgi:tRNA nucleotidyltransferase (CCA-adding enzyme)